MNWIEIYNKLFELINTENAYFSGPRFLNVARRFRTDLPDYYTYIEQLRSEGRNTSRKDYFRDILFSLPEIDRVELCRHIVQEIEATGEQQSKITDLRAWLVDQANAPTATIPDHLWNADRLNAYLEEIDTCITAADHQRAISLSYSCLEGFFRSFMREKIPDSDVRELVAMAERSKDIYVKRYPLILMKHFDC